MTLHTARKLVDPAFCNGCRFCRLKSQLAEVPGQRLPQPIQVVECTRLDCDNHDNSPNPPDYGLGLG